MSLSGTQIQVSTALKMIENYAKENGITGQGVAAIFDAGRLAAHILNPDALGAGGTFVQMYDELSLDDGEQPAAVAHQNA